MTCQAHMYPYKVIKQYTTVLKRQRQSGSNTGYYCVSGSFSLSLSSAWLKVAYLRGV